jgi:hypothetical protein
MTAVVVVIDVPPITGSEEVTSLQSASTADEPAATLSDIRAPRRRQLR